MNKRINVGVIGVGNMGRHHARVYSEIEGVDLVAVVDADKNNARRVARKFNCRYYDNISQLLTAENLDAATIAVPTSMHKDVALVCIDHGIPVLIEKPIAESIASAQKIIKHSEKDKVAVCVGHIERFNPVVARLKNFVSLKKFGKIIAMNTKRVGLYPPQITDTDVIVDLAVHDIDVCSFILEKGPQSVYARAGKALNSKRFDYADIFLNYDGIDVIIQVNWITPVKVRELTLTGIKGYAELSYMNQTLKIYKKGHGEDIEIVNIEEISLRKEEPLKREIKSFTDYIRGRKAGVVTAREALLSLRVALAAIRSHRLQQRVKL